MPIDSRTHASLHAAAGAAAAVALQVVLSRVFSVILWYHLGFLCISIAMLGTTLGALIVRRWRSHEPKALLATASVIASLAVALIVRIPLEAQAMLDRPGEIVRLFAIVLVTALPFASFGAISASALAREREIVGRVYASSFLGGAIGAIGAYLAMHRLGAPLALGLISLVPLVPLITAPRDLLRGLPLAALILGSALVARPDDLLPMGSAKHFPRIPSERILKEEWNAFSRVTFYENPERHGLWELPPGSVPSLPRSIGVAIDAWAITSILEIKGPLDRAFLQHYPPTLGYVGAQSDFSALVIGAGGGVDVHAALTYGAKAIDAVEINPLIVNAVRGDFREFAGDLYRDPRVNAVIDEGRHFVESTDREYDRIVLTGVDTFAATDAGAFALSENFLYTQEAIRHYLEHLNSGGRLVFTRWWFEPERQTTRLYLTILDALRHFSIDDPENHVFVAHTAMNSVVLVKRDAPFEPKEVDALLAELPQRGLALAWAPGRAPLHQNFGSSALVNSEEARSAYPYDIEPTTDDRPFFFENSRLHSLFRAEGDWIHDRLGGLEIVVITMFSCLVLALPLLFLVRSKERVAGRVTENAWLLACLVSGIAYVMVEAAILPPLSRVLGHPSQAVSVVLVVVLVFSGVGSLVAQKIDPTRLARVLFGVALFVGPVLILGMEELSRAIAGTHALERTLATILLLALPAFAMGLPLTLLLRRGTVDSDGVLKGVAWNGVGSALGGPLAALLSLTSGFTVTLAVAAAVYALAALLAASLGGTSSEGDAQSCLDSGTVAPPCP